MMKWWKRPLVLSLAWFVIVMALSDIGVWYITNDNHPSATLTPEQRSEKLGHIAAQLLVLGLGAIWWVAYARHRKRRQEEPRHQD
jgi:hypothetical protein